MIALWLGCRHPEDATQQPDPIEVIDLDGDGYTPSENDCDESDDAVHPGAAETPSDGIDSDCDGTDLPVIELMEVARVRVEGTAIDENLGVSVACSFSPVGPFGAAVAVGADMFYSDTSDQGYALVLDGSRSGLIAPSEADWRVDGENNDELGYRVVFPGDTDGDGDDELLVTAIKAYRPDPQTGAAFLFDVSSPGLQTTNDARSWIQGSEGGAMLGGAAAAGDVDGDGLADILISDTFLNWAARAGEVRLYPASDLSEVVTPDGALFRLVAEELLTPTGYAMLVHELTGDGVDDLALGEYQWGTGLYGESVGRTRIYAGPLSDDVFDEPVSLTGASGDGESAVNLTAGDLDGDGFGDIGIGAHTSDERRGRAYVAFGPIVEDRPLASSEVILRGESDFAWFGGGIAALDHDGDGVDDLAVGAPSDPFFGPERPGLVYLFLSPLAPGDRSAAEADRVYRGIEPRELLGWAMTGCDLGGDGHDELVIGAPGAANGMFRAGRLLVIDGF